VFLPSRVTSFAVSGSRLCRRVPDSSRHRIPDGRHPPTAVFRCIAGARTVGSVSWLIWG